MSSSRVAKWWASYTRAARRREHKSAPKWAGKVLTAAHPSRLPVHSAEIEDARGPEGALFQLSERQDAAFEVRVRRTVEHRRVTAAHQNGLPAGEARGVARADAEARKIVQRRLDRLQEPADVAGLGRIVQVSELHRH